jgi:hypothetical protein
VLLGHSLTAACSRFRRMIAAFGSGAAFSLVSGMSGANPVAGAFSTGVVFALLQGGIFKVGVADQLCARCLVPYAPGVRALPPDRQTWCLPGPFHFPDVWSVVLRAAGAAACNSLGSSSASRQRRRT